MDKKITDDDIKLLIRRKLTNPAEAEEAIKYYEQKLKEFKEKLI